MEKTLCFDGWLGQRLLSESHRECTPRQNPTRVKLPKVELTTTQALPGPGIIRQVVRTDGKKKQLHGRAGWLCRGASCRCSWCETLADCDIFAGVHSRGLTQGQTVLETILIVKFVILCNPNARLEVLS